jgi:hypothetical protein
MCLEINKETFRLGKAESKQKIAPEISFWGKKRDNLV